MSGFLKRGTVWVLSLTLISMGMPLATRAAVIDTQTYVEMSQRDADLARVTAGLARSEVRDRMLALGVNPADVEARLSVLTDSELRQLADRFDQLPAGGDLLAVVGVVFIVLLILELVGVIDIFKKT